MFAWLLCLFVLELALDPSPELASLLVRSGPGRRTTDSRSIRQYETAREGWLKGLLPDAELTVVEFDGRRVQVAILASVGNSTSQPPIVMLHGFPDDWTTFATTATRLAELGHRVILPTIKGYSPGDVQYADSFTLPKVAVHCMTVLAALNVTEFHVVGHDWGAAVAAVLAQEYPAVKSLTTIAFPLTFISGMHAVPSQLLNSWYIFFFQLPVAPIVFLRYGDGLTWLWNSWANGLIQDTTKHINLAADQEGSIKSTFASPGVTLAALAYYRHNIGAWLWLMASTLFFAIRFQQRLFARDWNGLIHLLGVVIALVLLAHTGVLPFYSPLGTAEFSTMAKVLKQTPFAVPVLSLFGQQDNCILSANFDYLTSVADGLLPQGHHEHSLNGGHFCHQTNVDLVAQLVHRWVRGQGNDSANL